LDYSKRPPWAYKYNFSDSTPKLRARLEIDFDKRMRSALSLTGSNLLSALVAEIVGELERSFEDGFERFFPWFAVDTTTKLKRSEIRLELTFGDASMGREPGSRQRSVALAGIDVNVSIDVFAVLVDDVFAVECVVLIQRFVRPKAVSVDGE
jgi:hypothetical protein